LTLVSASLLAPIDGITIPELRLSGHAVISVSILDMPHGD